MTLIVLAEALAEAQQRLNGSRLHGNIMRYSSVGVAYAIDNLIIP